MAEIELYAILFGRGAAVCGGAGDFSGGIATKRSGVLTVAMASQLVGIILLLITALLFGEAIPRGKNSSGEHWRAFQEVSDFLHYATRFHYTGWES